MPATTPERKDMKPGSDDATRFDHTTAARALLEREMGRVHHDEVGPWLGQIAASLDAMPSEGVSAERWQDALNIALAGAAVQPAAEVAQRPAASGAPRPAVPSPLPAGVLRRAHRQHLRMPSQPLR